MQLTQDDPRFPGMGRTPGGGRSQMVSGGNSDSNLQARLLDNSSPDRPSDIAATGTGEQLSDGRY
jgi:hypothetical protein